MKKPSRRSNTKHPNLKKKYNLRIRHEGLDQDYLSLLNEEELAWMDRFMQEENGASFRNDGNDLNTTKEERKVIYDRNNARQRCLLSQAKSQVGEKGLVNYDEVAGYLEQKTSSDHLENAYVDYIEFKEIQAMMKEYNEAMLKFREASG